MYHLGNFPSKRLLELAKSWQDQDQASFPVACEGEMSPDCATVSQWEQLCFREWVKGSEEGEGEQDVAVTVFSSWIITLVLSYSLASPALTGLNPLSTRVLKTSSVSHSCCVPSSTEVEMVEMWQGNRPLSPRCEITVKVIRPRSSLWYSWCQHFCSLLVYLI